MVNKKIKGLGKARNERRASVRIPSYGPKLIGFSVLKTEKYFSTLSVKKVSR